ncbi:MAG: hypothetical protein H6678_01580 [Candidatus Delongbacteria bacterium]|nr:hypothetical protein [Candidatus Delongbacteria bacterium]
MGAFLLHARDERMDERGLAEVFAQRGFSSVQRLELGSSILHLAGKRHLTLSNLCQRELSGAHRALLAVTGSLVYDGLSWDEALERLMDDLLEDTLRTDRLAGAFCLIFHRSDRDAVPRVISDPSGLYHLFQDSRGRVLSSSQLLVLHALPEPWTIDRAACLDLLTSGYLVAPRTVFEDLRLVTTASPPLTASCFRFEAQLVDVSTVPDVRGGLAAHVEFQLESLKEHLALCRGLTRTLGVDMGLSGGYDSRLLILLAHDGQIPFSCHTHVKEGDDRDRVIARMLAERLGLPLAELVTTAPGAMPPEELEAVLSSSFAFYDGHAVEMMNLLKHEYTPEYRVRALGRMGINLSGVGGEIFRNYNYTRPVGSMDARSWVAYHVINHRNLRCVAAEDARESMVNRQTAAILGALGLASTRRLDFRQTRRYYGEVWLSNWHGVRNSVESTLAVYLTPFSDRRVLRNALASSAHLGVSGKFEAAMIQALNPELASLPSNYGHDFSRIPLKHSLRAGIRAWLPNPLKLALARRMARTSGSRQAADALISRHPILARALEQLERLELPLDWNSYLAGPSMRILAFSLGYVLHRLEARTRTSINHSDLLREEESR